MTSLRRVKLLTAESAGELEELINEFFDEQGDSINLIDIKYVIVHKAIAVDSETGVYSDSDHSAMIIYSL